MQPGSTRNLLQIHCHMEQLDHLRDLQLLTTTLRSQTTYKE